MDWESQLTGALVTQWLNQTWPRLCGSNLIHWHTTHTVISKSWSFIWLFLNYLKHKLKICKYMVNFCKWDVWFPNFLISVQVIWKPIIWLFEYYHHFWKSIIWYQNYLIIISLVLNTSICTIWWKWLGIIWFLLFLLKTPLFHDVSFDHHLTILSIILIILNFCSCALIGLHSSIIKQPSCHNSLFSTISCDNFMLIFWNQIHCLTTLFGFIGHLF